MKKAFALLLTLAMAIALIGCSDNTSSASSAAASGSTGSSGSGAAPSVDPDAVPTGTLKVLLSEEPASGNTFVATLEKWAADTGNELELVVIPYDDQTTKFPQMARAGDVPDLVVSTRLGRQYPEEFYDLSDVVDMSIFEEQAAKVIGLQQDPNYDKFGAYVLLPFQFTITNVFYNADAFAAAGLTPPTVDSPWTLEQYEEAAQKLMDEGGVRYGMAMDYSRARYDNMMYMYGGGATREDGNGGYLVNSNSPENITALEKFVSWNETGLMPKQIWAGGGNDNPADYFKNGDVGIYFSGSWNYAPFTEAISAFEWGVMPSPAGPDGNRSAIIGGTGLGVPTSAQRSDLGLAFIKWFFENPENYSYYLDMEKGMSALKDVTYTPTDDKIAADFAIMQAETANISDLFMVDNASSWLGFMDAEYREAIALAVNGDVTPAQSLNQFATDLAAKSGWEMTTPAS